MTATAISNLGPQVSILTTLHILLVDFHEELKMVKWGNCPIPMTISVAPSPNEPSCGKAISYLSSLHAFIIIMIPFIDS